MRTVTTLVIMLYGCVFLPGYAHKDHTYPKCQMSQLRLRLFALDAPGMSKLYSMYAVTNLSSSACALRADALSLWAGSRNRPLLPISEVRAEHVKPLIILPHSAIHSMPMNNVVWTAVSAVGDTAPTFNTLWWAVDSPLKYARSVKYPKPYTHFAAHTLLHQGLRDWTMSRDCRGQYAALISLQPSTKINPHDFLYCG
jgi:hypothetical protein